ncbi:MAG: hypothetical protein AAFX78_10425 [Cyanobacteria bacterium J06638_20]
MTKERGRGLSHSLGASDGWRSPLGEEVSPIPLNHLTDGDRP